MDYRYLHGGWTIGTYMEDGLKVLTWRMDYRYLHGGWTIGTYLEDGGYSEAGQGLIEV